MFSFIDRILDRVDPSLESYGDPFLWRGSESEMKYFSALKLASCNCQVSVQYVLLKMTQTVILFTHLSWNLPLVIWEC